MIMHVIVSRETLYVSSLIQVAAIMLGLASRKDTYVNTGLF